MDNPILHKLPPELRNTIYEMVFTLPDRVIFERVIFEGHRETGDWTLTKHSESLMEDKPLALARTCKAIRAESKAIFFNINTVMLARCPPDEINTSLQSFGCTVGQHNFAALRQIVVEVGNGSRFGGGSTRSSRICNFIYTGVSKLQALTTLHQHLSFSARFNFQVPAHLVNCGCRLVVLDFELDLDDLSKSWEAILPELRRQLMGKVSHSVRIQFLSQLNIARNLIGIDTAAACKDGPGL